MTRITLYRVLVIVAAVLLLELLCLTGVIDRLTMPAPHVIVRDLAKILISGSLNAAIAKTLTNASIALGLALVVGVATAVALHGHRAVRETLDPLFATYYAVPIFAFYPLLIVLLGLDERAPDRDRFHARRGGGDRQHAQRVGPGPSRVAQDRAHPAAGRDRDRAVAYSLIGIIGAEFIMSRGGIGYEISFAYTNFDNATMYPLILLILVVSISINSALSWWEKVLLARRGQ
jgi:NitT/TauT family transport system permease protein